MDQRVEIVPYSPSWPVEFHAIADALRAALGDLALRIDHIGSTAAPGLPAKDVIDLQITVSALAVDLIYFAAEEWAAATGWRPGPSDA